MAIVVFGIIVVFVGKLYLDYSSIHHGIVHMGLMELAWALTLETTYGNGLFLVVLQGRAHVSWMDNI